jgi:hypothetical protein
MLRKNTTTKENSIKTLTVKTRCENKATEDAFDRSYIPKLTLILHSHAIAKISIAVRTNNSNCGKLAITDLQDAPNRANA